jgi:DNA (cytosine-5)-methyltransferase 1
VNVGSLFSGAGLMDWGLTLAGFEHAWFCERDAYCRRVLGLRYPGVPVYEDVRSVGESAPGVDLIAGGFPCQPVSDAGLLKAQEDERWLWPEMARVVAELRPRWVLVENVLGLRTRGLDIVRRDLDSLEYRSRPLVMSACEFGAPHPRRRLFVVAHSASVGLEGLGHNGCAETTPQRVEPPRQGAGRAGAWAAESCPPGVAHGVPDRVDRLRALGNGVVPQVAYWLGKRIRECEAVIHAGAPA